MPRFQGRYIFNDDNGGQEHVTAVCEARDKYAARTAFMEYGECQSLTQVPDGTPLSGPFAEPPDEDDDEGQIVDDSQAQPQTPPPDAA